MSDPKDYDPGAVIDRKWFAKPDDLIGGWCVMDVDATPGESHRPAVADFVSEEVAKYIAALHNYRLRPNGE